MALVAEAGWGMAGVARVVVRVQEGPVVEAVVVADRPRQERTRPG